MAEVELEEVTTEEPIGMVSDDIDDEESEIEVFAYLDAGNLVDKLKNPAEVGGEVRRLFDVATQSMAPWLKKYKRALKLAKLEPEAKEKTFPFEKASNVVMPFILETMLDFHSRTVPELVWRPNVVGIRTYGKENEEKMARAERVGDYMNYQITDGMRYWRSEQDKLLLQLPCVGTGYKETYFNSTEKEVASDLLMADEVVFDHDCRTFEEAPDYFIKHEYTHNEVIAFIRGKSDWQLDEANLPDRRNKPTLEFICAYTWIDIDGDGLPEPYKVIYYTETEAIVAVYPAYDEDGIHANDDGEIIKIDRMPCFTQYRFLPDPEGGPMGLGWGILMGDMFDAINTTFNQMIDGGTLGNLSANSGLIDAQLSGGSGRGNRQQAGPIEVKLGELTPVVTGGKTMAQSVYQFPFTGADQTLYQLTTYMVEQMRGMTNAAMNMDTSSQEAAIMYLTRLQQGLKVPNSIVMRVYECAKHEFKNVALLNFKNHNTEKYNRVLDGDTEFNMAADFNPEDCDIKLAIDPSQGSDVERQAKADMILQEAKEDQSGILDKRYAYLQWFDALGVPDPEGYAPEPSGEPDPMQQLMVANMQREAQNDERRLKLDEYAQDLRRHEIAMKASQAMTQLGLDADVKEADITKKYVDAFKLIWEMDMQGNPIEVVQEIEGALIDRAPPLIEVPKPLESAPPQMQPNGPPPPQGMPPV